MLHYLFLNMFLNKCKTSPRKYHRSKEATSVLTQKILFLLPHSSKYLNFQSAKLAKRGRNVSAKWWNIESVLITNSPLPLLPRMTWLRYWWGEIFIHILLVYCISGFQPRNWMLFEKKHSSLLLAGLISPHNFLACLQWEDGDSYCSLLTYWSGKKQTEYKNHVKIFHCYGVKNCRAWTPPHSVLSALYVLSHWFNPQKSDWQTSPLGNRASGTGMFLPSIFFLTSFSAHQQHVRKNRLDTRNKAACCWPTWMWPRSAGKGRELWKPAARPRAKVWSPVDWRPSSPEERVFCCRAKHRAHTPPTITTILLRMIDALSSPYSREKALDSCIIDWGWEKRGGKKEWKSVSQKQEDRLCGCVFALE